MKGWDKLATEPPPPNSLAHSEAFPAVSLSKSFKSGFLAYSCCKISFFLFVPLDLN